MTLKQKLFSIALFPLFICFCALLYLVQEKYSLYQTADKISLTAYQVANMSKLVGQLQLERGKTNAFINSNTVSELELKDIYKNTDLYLAKFNSEKSPFDSYQKYKDDLRFRLSQIGQIREMSQQRKVENTSKVISYYTETISNILKSYIHLRDEAKNPQVAQGLISLYRVEVAREIVGQTRAKINVFLSTNKAMSMEEYSLYVGNLKRIESEFNSDQLKFTNEKYLSNFRNIKNSNVWKNLENYSNDIYANHAVGKYTSKSTNWFSDTSTIMSEMGQIIGDEINLGLVKYTSQIARENLKMFLIFLFSGICALVFSIWYPIYTSSPITKFVYAMKKVASGDLAIDIKTNKHDEVSEMSNQLQMTAENLEKVFMRKNFKWEEIAQMKKDQETAMTEAVESKNKAIESLKDAELALDNAAKAEIETKRALEEAKKSEERAMMSLKDAEIAKIEAQNASERAVLASQEAKDLAEKIKHDNEEMSAKVRVIQNIVVKVGEGDLTQRIPFEGQDAIGLISVNLNSLFLNFRSQILELNNVVSNLGELVNSFEKINLGLSAAQEETVAKVVTVSSSSEEISSSIQSVSAATEEMMASISEISKMTQESNKLVSSTSSEVEHSALLVDQLSKSSDGINNIVQIINTLAAQTNLLALNATIEAARAGEAGRGFAVVAHEIKELAHQTHTATKSIEENIQAIQGDSATVIHSISNISKAFENISSFSINVSAAIEQQVSTSKEIGHSMMEASQGIESVTSSMFEVRAVTEDTAKNVNLSSNSVKQIAAISKNLGSLVSKYKTSEEGGTGTLRKVA